MHAVTLRASLSGTFLQTLPDLVTPLKGYSLSPRSCPPKSSGTDKTVEATYRPIPSLISLMVSVDVKHHVYLIIAQARM